MSNHGYGFGVHNPNKAGASIVGALPSSLSGYIVGIDYSSYVDPGGGSSREVVNPAITNLAPTVTLVPHFDPGNLPLLHDGDWVRDASTIPGPAVGKTWFSVNKNKDSDFSTKTEWEVDVSGAGATEEMTFVFGLYQPSSEGALWLAPYYCATERAAISSVSGRIDVVSNDATRSNLVAAGDSDWAQDKWNMWALSTGEDAFESSMNGITSTYSTSPVGLGGLMTLANASWGTTCDGGFTCLHIWNVKHSLATLAPVLAYLADRHGLPYTA